MSTKSVEKKLNLNPKRLITFERRNLNNLKAQLRVAEMNGEPDYQLWLLNRIQWTEKVLEKKIKNISK